MKKFDFLVEIKNQLNEVGYSTTVSNGNLRAQTSCGFFNAVGPILIPRT